MVKLKGFFKGAESVNIVMGGGRRLDRVKVIGVTDANSVKGGFPYELHNMLVVEKENGKRLMIKASLIKMIEESEETESVSIDDGSRRD